MFTVGVRGNEVELSQELCLCGIGGIDNPQSVHLNIRSMSLPHCDVEFDRLSFVGLTVSDDDCYFSNPRSSAEESLLSRFSDGSAGVGSLAHIRHFPDRLLDVLFIYVANQIELQVDIQAVEDQANSGGVASNSGAVH